MATTEHPTLHETLARLPLHRQVAQLSLLYLGAILTLACTTALVLELAHG
ncbi:MULTISPECIES: hypothetical protein [unclassified Pseudomonas]|nr:MULTISPECIES: hypothetical protein [unclassified Pseudomonas]